MEHISITRTWSMPLLQGVIRLQVRGQRIVWKLPRHKDANTGKECRGGECRPFGQTPKKFKNGEVGRERGEDQWITIRAWKCPSGHWAKRRVKLNVPGHPEFGWDPATMKMPPKRGNKVFKADPISWAALPSRHLRKTLKESLKLSGEPKGEPSAAGCGDRSKSEQFPKETSFSDKDPA